MALARAISIVGHPIVVLPGAVAGLLALRAETSASLWYTLAFAFVLGIGLLIYSYFMVRRGQWAHIDASDRVERRQLNHLTFVVLLLTTALSFYLQIWSISTVGLLGVTLMMGVILLVGPWLKVSLHTSFAALAASLFWGLWPILTVGALCVVLIGWSRLVLSRHSADEVVLGGLIGAATGAGLIWLTI